MKRNPNFSSKLFFNFFILAFFIAFFGVNVFAQKKTKPPKPSKYDSVVTLTTIFGDMTMILYEKTPKHRSNFLKLIQSKFYDDLLFHRVINAFMIQGGDPNSRNAKAGEMLGGGGGNERIPAEFDKTLYHKKGALAAARDGNPEKASSSCQFYIVQGKTFSETALQSIAQRNGMNYTEEQKKIYAEIGGTPHLDQNYTVYGEVIQGLDIIDKIASQTIGANDRPEKDIKMKIKVTKMKKTEIAKKYGYLYPEMQEKLNKAKTKKEKDKKEKDKKEK